MPISTRLRSRRLELGLTQQRLAMMAGIKQQTIQRIESGNSRHPRHLLEIADALQCSPKWLQYGVSDLNEL